MEMKFAVEKNDLSEALTRIVRVIPAVKGVKIEKAVYIKGVGEHLELQCGNAVMKMSMNIAANVQEAGEVAVDAKNLLDAVNKLGTVINLSIDKQQLVITGNTTRYSLRTFDVSEFVQIEAVVPEQTFTLSGRKVREIVNKVAISRSKDSSRPMFCGVLFDIDGGRLTAAATNAHRLSVLDMNIADLGVTRQLIIPAEAIYQFTKAEREDVRIGWDDTRVEMTQGDCCIIARLIAGVYPNYRKVAESPLETHTVEAVIPTAELRTAVDCMSFIANSLSNHNIRFEFADGVVNVSADNPDIGSATKDIKLAEYSGKELDISFNVNYIMDYLKAVDSERVKLLGSKPLVPVLLTEVGDEGFQYVVSPLRTGSR